MEVSSIESRSIISFPYFPTYSKPAKHVLLAYFLQYLNKALQLALIVIQIY